MDEISCLVFDLDQFRYAVETASVVEVNSFPPLQLLPDAPTFVIGAFDREGEKVPVIDLDLLLGHPVQPSHGSDHVVVLRGRGRLLGLLAQTIVGTRSLPGHGSVRSQSPGGQKPQGWRFVSGLVAIDHSLVMLLDSDALQAGLEEHDTATPKPVLADLTDGFDASSGARTAEERTEPADSADELAEALLGEAGHQALVAVVGWPGRRAAIPLHQVDEFSEIAKVTTLPGCPPHIWGQASLHGEIVTVVDLCRALGDAPMPRQWPATVVLVRPQDERLGVVVDEVREMLTVSSLEAARHGSPTYVIGTVRANGEALDVLDLLALLTSPDVVVDETDLIVPLESTRAAG